MLIGLNAESRAGKDSVAQILVRKYGFTQVALATAIRNILLDLDPWISLNSGEKRHLADFHLEVGGDWDIIKDESRDAVEWMIKLGQSARTNVSEDVWLEAAFPSGQRIVGNDIVVSDIRQMNEVQFMYRNGGELWKIKRDGTEKRGMDDLLRNVKFDETISNNGTLEDLENTVDLIMEDFA